MTDGIITQERLMEITGLRQKAALRRHLRKAGVPFLEINGNIFTTEDALTDRLAGRRARKKTQPRWIELEQFQRKTRAGK